MKKCRDGHAKSVMTFPPKSGTLQTRHNIYVIINKITADTAFFNFLSLKALQQIYFRILFYVTISMAFHFLCLNFLHYCVAVIYHQHLWIHLHKIFPVGYCTKNKHSKSLFVIYKSKKQKTPPEAGFM